MHVSCFVNGSTCNLNINFSTRCASNKVDWARLTMVLLVWNHCGISTGSISCRDIFNCVAQRLLNEYVVSRRSSCALRYVSHNNRPDVASAMAMSFREEKYARDGNSVRRRRPTRDHDGTFSSKQRDKMTSIS